MSETATLAGGCFWCVEACFEQLLGVSSVVSGYVGGDPRRADYKSVCSGTTGHAEVVQITFDPTTISFRELLQLFFAIHDPTTRNRQGADVGTQYRSAIFYHSPEQEQTSRAVVAELTAAGEFRSPIVTEISPMGVFHAAEDYHQGYYRNNPGNPYCFAVAGPKAAKTRKLFAGRLKPE
jgi:peptide-methionine (S)-S-oxide reductase